jgi:hypothetical protein
LEGERHVGEAGPDLLAAEEAEVAAVPGVGVAAAGDGERGEVAAFAQQAQNVLRLGFRRQQDVAARTSSVAGRLANSRLYRCWMA